MSVLSEVTLDATLIVASLEAVRVSLLNLSEIVYFSDYDKWIFNGTSGLVRRCARLASLYLIILYVINFRSIISPV